MRAWQGSVWTMVSSETEVETRASLSRSTAPPLAQALFRHSPWLDGLGRKTFRHGAPGWPLNAVSLSPISDRARRDPHTLGDLAIGEALRDPGDDRFPLAIEIHGSVLQSRWADPPNQSFNRVMVQTNYHRHT
jgi:hypothetical protein